VARRKLEVLAAAHRWTNCGFRRATGSKRSPATARAAQHPINDQWRLCFVWRVDGAENVEIVDYHD